MTRNLSWCRRKGGQAPRSLWRREGGLRPRSRRLHPGEAAAPLTERAELPGVLTGQARGPSGHAPPSPTAIQPGDHRPEAAGAGQSAQAQERPGRQSARPRHAHPGALLPHRCGPGVAGGRGAGGGTAGLASRGSLPAAPPDPGTPWKPPRLPETLPTPPAPHWEHRGAAPGPWNGGLCTSSPQA